MPNSCFVGFSCLHFDKFAEKKKIATWVLSVRLLMGHVFKTNISFSAISHRDWWWPNVDQVRPLWLPEDFSAKTAVHGLATWGWLREGVRPSKPFFCKMTLVSLNTLHLMTTIQWMTSMQKKNYFVCFLGNLKGMLKDKCAGLWIQHLTATGDTESLLSEWKYICVGSHSSRSCWP